MEGCFLAASLASGFRFSPAFASRPNLPSQCALHAGCACRHQDFTWCLAVLADQKIDDKRFQT